MEENMSHQINCDDLTFSLYPFASEMSMFESYYRNGKWDDGAIVDFHNISLSPAANILNYGQGIFEGLKAYYTTKGNIVLFRPDENAKRFEESAKKLGLTPAAICQYISKKRGRIKINNENIIREITASAKYIIHHGENSVIKETCRICRLMKTEGIFSFFCNKCKNE